MSSHDDRHSSPEHIVSCLTDLRRVFGTGQKTTAEHLSWQNGLYIGALADLMPEALAAACKQIIREVSGSLGRRIRDVAKGADRAPAGGSCSGQPQPEQAREFPRAL